MLTIWTSDTYFTAEPIGDQLSSLKQESQDTTTIVQTKVCIQIKFVAKIPGQKKPFPSWKCFVQEPFLRRRPRRTKSREPRVGAWCAICRQSTWGEDSTHKPVVHKNMKTRNQKFWKSWTNLCSHKPVTRCSREYENTESEALKSWTNLCSYLDCHNFGRSSHQRPTNALFAGRQNKAKLRVASY